MVTDFFTTGSNFFNFSPGDLFLCIADIYFLDETRKKRLKIEQQKGMNL